MNQNDSIQDAEEDSHPMPESTHEMSREVLELSNTSIHEDHGKQETMDNELTVESEETNSCIAELSEEWVVKSAPYQVTGAWGEFGPTGQNVTRGCKWSPDGLCVLTNSEDNCLRLFNTPEAVYTRRCDEWINLTELVPALKVKEGDLVYDFCWNPMMNSMDPATCCFVSTSRERPIHMWDAYTGALRSTYRPINHAEEIEPAYSLAFSSSGTKLYSGFNHRIRIYDVDYPRKPCITKSLKGCMVGIISCFAMHPSDTELYAVGSYLRTIGVFNSNEDLPVAKLEGQCGGLTHLSFSPCGTRLYSGGRKDNEILCWDMRNYGKVLYRIIRAVSTNQRIYFDIDKSGKYLVSGQDGGVISIWDTRQTAMDSINPDEEPILQPALNFYAHNDTVNGVSIHPTLPLLASTSGQRLVSPPSDSEDSDNDNMEEAKVETGDNSLRLWWLGQTCTNEAFVN